MNDLDKLIESSIKISGINNNITKEESKSLAKRDIETLLKTIKTYSDVCKALGEKEYNISDFSHIPEEYSLKHLYTIQLQQIAKLFNNGWIPNWVDHKEQKWFPYFKNTSRVGSGWHCHSRYCDDVYAHGVVVYYQTEEIAIFVGKQFQDIYIEYINSI